MHRAVALPHWVSIGLLLHHPNCSQSGWGDATVASIQTQWGDATARRGRTLVAASLGVCSQPECPFAVITGVDDLARRVDTLRRSERLSYKFRADISLSVDSDVSCGDVSVPPSVSGLSEEENASTSVTDSPEVNSQHTATLDPILETGNI